MRDEQAAVSRAPVAKLAVTGIALLPIVVWAVSSGPRAYGVMSDEFYYLDCARHLAWGYVDHPPFSIAVLAAVQSVLGTSLLALRFVPAVMLALDVVLVALLARELGGGRVAQALAALGVATAPAYLACVGFYSMNSFEPVFWSGAMLLLARIVNDGSSRHWLLLGLVLGLGLLDKVSVLWLGLGLGIGMLLTPERRWLGTRWPWLCAALALAIFAPHLVWQVRNDWPTLEFMRNARELKMVSRSPLGVLREQLLPWLGALPLCAAGLWFYFGSRTGRPHRWLGWIWLTVMALLAASGTARANYSAPAYAALLAGGAVALESFAARRRWVPAFAACLLVGVGAGSAPFAVPLLSPPDLVAYGNALGVRVEGGERASSGVLPLHFALRFGWRELVAQVVAATETLSPEERRQAVVLAPSFGAAGAVNFYRRLRPALPPAVSGHNSYWLWGPGRTRGEVVIAIAADPAFLEGAYRSVEWTGDVDCTYCRPEIAHYRIYVCRGLRRPLADLWRDLKHYE